MHLMRHEIAHFGAGKIRVSDPCTEKHGFWAKIPCAETHEIDHTDFQLRANSPEMLGSHRNFRLLHQWNGSIGSGSSRFSSSYITTAVLL